MKSNERSMEMTKQNPMKAEIEEKSNCTSKVDSESPKDMIEQIQ